MFRCVCLCVYYAISMDMILELKNVPIHGLDIKEMPGRYQPGVCRKKSALDHVSLFILNNQGTTG